MRGHWGIFDSAAGPFAVAVASTGVLVASVMGVDSGSALATTLVRQGYAVDRFVRDEGRVSEAAGRFCELAYGRVGALPPMQATGTAFQCAVWRSLLRIPAGETSTYGGLARQLGRPGAARAIGQAVGANPLAVFIPCHRVIGMKGALGGYAWGLSRKRALLHAEARSAGTGLSIAV